MGSPYGQTCTASSIIQWLYNVSNVRENYATHYGNDAYACHNAREMYFRGLGTVQDYARAVQYLEMDRTKDKRCDLLGICYLLGYGCQQNVERGKTLLLGSKNTIFRNYGLGMMYAEGLGVPEDIQRGVEYLKAAGDDPPAKEALTHYKKSLFGVWRRK